MDNESILAAVVLLVALLIFVVLKVHQQTQQDPPRFLADTQSRQLIAGALMIFLIIISVIINYGLHMLREQMQQQAATSLSTVIQTTDSSLDAWYQNQVSSLQLFSQRDKTVELVAALLAKAKQANETSSSTNTYIEELRQRFHALPTDPQRLDFFIVGNDDMEYASLTDDNLNTTSFLATQHRASLQQAFAGKTLMIGPVRSQTSLHLVQKGLGAHNTTLFFVGPVRDKNNRVIAVIAFRIDPFLELFKLVTSGRVGSTGETYLVNQQGIIASPSRFESQLTDIGLLASGQSSILNIKSADPEQQLDSASLPNAQQQSQWPLTFSAEAVLKGTEGLNAKGYRDYRGVKVLGAWRYNSDLQLGLVSEISLQEVQQGYLQLRYTILAVLASIIVLTVLLANIALNIVRRMNNRLLQTNSELEKRVAMRTKELSDREARLWDLYQNSPVAYATLKHDGSIAKHNKVFAQLTGYSTEQISQLTWQQLLPANDSKHNGMALLDSARDGLSQQDVVIDLANAKSQTIKVSVSAVPAKQGREVRVSLVDVTQREKALAKLTQNEQQFRSMVSNIPGVVFRFYFGSDFYSRSELVFVSPKIVELTGHPPAKFVGKDADLNFRDFVHSDDKASLEALISKSFKDLKPFATTLKITDKHQHIRTVQLKAGALIDTVSQSKYFDGVMIDITEQESLKTELLKSESRYRSILDSVAEGVVVVDKQGRIQEFSTAAQRIFGYTREQVIGQNISLIQPQQQQNIDEQRAQHFDNKQRPWVVEQGGEVLARRKSGDVFPMELSIKESELEGKTVFIGIMRDITERHEQELKLKQSEERLDAATYGARIGLWEFFPDKSIIKINKISANMLGLGHNSDFIEEEKDWFTLYDSANAWGKYIHPEDKEFAEQRMTEYLRGQRTEFKEELRLGTDPDNCKWILDVGRITETDNNGRATRVSGVHIDITERKQLELDYLKAQQLAEEANQAKSDFLANMSHEIRTPMNAIIGMSHLALETDLNKQQRNYIDRVHRSAESLLGIINDILDFSKIEAGKLDVEETDFNLADILDNVANFISIKAEEKKLELLFDIEPNLPMRLIGDPLRLTQVLINLASNAVKFTDKGDVIIRIRRQFTNQDYAGIEFSVIDSGIGISRKQQKKLFQPFTQADASTTRKHGGTGLGLVISQKLVRLMGGEISLKSEPDQGSTFSFSITLKRQKTDNQPKPTRHQHIDKILVIDDNPHARVIFANMLTSLGYLVDTVDNALTALTMIQQADKTTPYQLVIIDWQMPQMDGIETTHKIQHSLALAQQPVIFMITAYGREELDLHTDEVKIAAILTKPVTASSLNDAINDVMGSTIKKRHHNSRREINKESIKALQGARILAVEDNDINQELIVGLLTNNGIECCIASNGQEAIERIQKEPFDGVLMDCQMPIMDGYTATKILRQQHKFKQLPILAMTANAMAGDREKAIQAGMNDHIPKPINVNNLFNTMAKWISVDSDRPSIEQPRLHSELELPQDWRFIDRQDGLNRTLNDATLYHKLLVKFHQNQQHTDHQLQQLIDDNNLTEVQRLLHTLKGLAGNIGAHQLQQQAEQLERFASTCDDCSQLNIDALRQALRDVLTEIAAIDEPSKESSSKRAISDAQWQQMLAELTQMLADYDSQAGDFLQSQYDKFEQRSDAAWLKKLTTAVENYDYDQALSLIAQQGSATP
ncbi:PAS domain S-box protein [Thalassotalea ponticola]|uniref:PAS domain S-box protein n=1 Tax=Thalassotalea ponticola TaxID=1523392 RepID=UPI0025B4409E|nr:PAS domain S-box protein [Thalassotalea ponticola]MDN3653552.1 PAS domain S-box protein [Thalassotalea ponticola]